VFDLGLDSLGRLKPTAPRGGLDSKLASACDKADDDRSTQGPGPGILRYRESRLALEDLYWNWNIVTGERARNIL
jgi:hypothetical protein